ncbi:hypothetical protein [Portibacter marinus]|uniref:hypothetical protein n=1 Tax=Portibacter marinus TaxID=2898660 RepID=UPI001F1A5449|nr:hypothetical protein [Portibacter marinus]
MKTLFLFTCLCALWLSCQNANDQLVGHYYTKANHNNRFDGPYISSNDKTVRFTKESFLDFYRDGSYLAYFDKLEQGHYQLVRNSIELTSTEDIKYELLFIEDGSLGHFKFPISEKVITLSKTSNRLKPDYPFIPKLNEWRNKPDAKMSNNELIEKFQNYSLFMSKYLLWAKKNDLHLGLTHISGPLQFGNNGLMMRKLKDTGDWCQYFYQGDCQEMDKILRNYFEDLVIDWKYTHDRVSMLSNALGQVSKGIEVHKTNFK